MKVKTRRYHHGLWLLIGGLLIAITIYLSFSNEPGLLTMTNGDKYGHFIAYFVLMAWFGLIYPSPTSWLICTVLLSGMGVGIELLQRLTATRAFELMDVVASISGVYTALIVIMIGASVFGLPFLQTRESSCEGGSGAEGTTRS